MVSVIIPAFNREKVLKRAIESCLNQTVTDIEVIVIDDGSTDGTKEVVESISDSRVKYIYQENAGACAARNYGIREASGEYIAFQDSDDAWHSEKLEKQLKVLKEKNADIVFCGFVKRFISGKERKIPECFENKFYTQRELIYESIVSTQTIIGKAGVIRNVLFDESMPRMQDYDFIIRASATYKVFGLAEYLVDVYEQTDSITASKKQYKKRMEVTEKLLEKYPDLCKKYPEWEIKMLKILAHCRIMIGHDATSILKKVYKLQKNVQNYIKLLLNRVGLLKILFRIRRDE